MNALETAWQRAADLAARRSPDPRMMLDAVAQMLAEAAMSPHGIAPATCGALARLVDAALVRNAPVAPMPKVVPISWGRRG